MSDSNSDKNNKSNSDHKSKSDEIKIALMIGSLRKASINRSFAEYVVAQFPDNVIVNEVKISDLPLYNAEYDEEDGELPDSYKRLRAEIDDADLLFIFTPEYNRSIPGLLKNAIDIASRPKETAVLMKKKVAIATASPGAYGGRSCGFDLRKVFLPYAAPILPQSEVYLSKAKESLDDDGNVSSERTQKFLQQLAAAIVDFAAD